MTTIPARCPFAVWRGQEVPNVGGALELPPIRIVVHVMQGTLEGTDAWFRNKDSQVSAHFGVGKLGQVYQWVDMGREAWAEMNYNPTSWSIEHEGESGETLTAKQLEASVRLIRWLGNFIDRSRGLPEGTAATMTTKPSDVGVIGHGELGMAGGNHPECPGSPILRQIGDALHEARLKTVKAAPKVAPEQTREAHMEAPEEPTTPAAPAPVAAPAPAKSETMISSTQLKVWLAELAAVAGWVNTYVNAGHLSTDLRAIQAIVSSVVLVVSHMFNKAKVSR